MEKKLYTEAELVKVVWKYVSQRDAFWRQLIDSRLGPPPQRLSVQEQAEREWRRHLPPNDPPAPGEPAPPPSPHWQANGTTLHRFLEPELPSNNPED